MSAKAILGLGCLFLYVGSNVVTDGLSGSYDFWEQNRQVTLSKDLRPLNNRRHLSRPHGDAVFRNFQREVHGT